jgi:hypothetical protein
MALQKQGLKTAVVAIMTSMLTKETNSIDDFATQLVDAIDIYVKTATVTVTVATAGTATAQTGTGTGTIS